MTSDLREPTRTVILSVVRDTPNHENSRVTYARAQLERIYGIEL